jgi:hypothetical protein
MVSLVPIDGYVTGVIRVNVSAVLFMDGHPIHGSTGKSFSMSDILATGDANPEFAKVR